MLSVISSIPFKFNKLFFIIVVFQHERIKVFDTDTVILQFFNFLNQVEMHIVSSDCNFDVWFDQTPCMLIAVQAYITKS